MNSRSDFSIVTCEVCKTGLRVPNNRGTLEIRCTKCNHRIVLEAGQIKIRGRNRLSDFELQKIFKEKISQIKKHRPKVGVFGVTGVGKSSLCNALFGHDTAKISDVEACTREPESIFINTGNNQGIELIDVPGVGETVERDREYFDLYKSLAPKLDLIIWVIKADDRSYAISQKAYQEILEPNLKKCPVVFAINQVDKLPPMWDWDRNLHKPGAEKEHNIQRKVDDVSKAFRVSKNKVIPISVEERYNLKQLVSIIMDILPNQTKFSFYREASENLKDDETKYKAEKGIWDYLKEYAGEAWEVVKEQLIATAASALPTLLSRLFRK